MKIFKLSFVIFNLLILFPIFTYGQDLVCSSSSYENINVDGRYTKKENSIMILKISDNKIFAEISSSLTKKTYLNIYNIESKYNQDYLAYEKISDKSSLVLSTLSLSLEKMIATHIVFGATDASVTILKCMSR